MTTNPYILSAAGRRLLRLPEEYNPKERISQSKPIFGAPLNRSHWAAQGLIAHYAMNEGCGDLIHDSCSCGTNDGKLINMAPMSGTSGWDASCYGDALTFDGSNDYVNISAAAPYLTPFGFTLCVWLKTNVTSTHILTATRTAGNYGLLYVLNDRACLYYSNTDYVYTAKLIKDNSYHFLVAYFSGLATTSYMYLDGVYSNWGLASTATSFLGTLAGSFYLGKAQAQSAFNGQISSASFYNCELSAEKVAYLYALPGCMYDAE